MKRNDADKRSKVHHSDKADPQTIDGATGAVIPTPRTPNLSNARDLRLEMAYLYRQWLAKQLDSNEMNKGIWALSQMLDAYEKQELEKRILELEEQQARGGGLIPGQRQLPARTLN